MCYNVFCVLKIWRECSLIFLDFFDVFSVSTCHMCSFINSTSCSEASKPLERSLNLHHSPNSVATLRGSYGKGTGLV